MSLTFCKQFAITSPDLTMHPITLNVTPYLNEPSYRQGTPIIDFHLA